MSTAITPTPDRAWRVWSEAWRQVAAATTGAVLLLALVGSKTKGYESATTVWFFVDLILGIVSLLLLTQRRRWPFAIALCLTVASSMSASALGAAGIAFISFATHRNRPRIVVLSVVWLLSGFVFGLAHPAPHESTGDIVASVVIGFLSVAFCIATGAAIGARRELLASLRERLEAAQAENRARTEQARVAERTRIAREMHDVLAHRISLVAMHSGALAYRTNLTPQEVQTSSIIIRDNAQHALAELREVLGVLRATDLTEADRTTITTPQPSLDGVVSMVDELPTADGPTDLQIMGDIGAVPETVSRNAFRVIQECLTNRRKHAPGTSIEIVIAADPVEVTIRSRNAVATRDRRTLDVPHSGLGLIGLRERATLSGGELSFGTDRAGDFVVRARFPIATEKDEQP